MAPCSWSPAHRPAGRSPAAARTAAGRSPAAGHRRRAGRTRPAGRSPAAARRRRTGRTRPAGRSRSGPDRRRTGRSPGPDRRRRHRSRRRHPRRHRSWCCRWRSPRSRRTGRRWDAHAWPRRPRSWTRRCPDASPCPRSRDPAGRQRSRRASPDGARSSHCRPSNESAPDCQGPDTNRQPSCSSQALSVSLVCDLCVRAQRTCAQPCGHGENSPVVALRTQDWYPLRRLSSTAPWYAWYMPQPQATTMSGSPMKPMRIQPRQMTRTSPKM